MLQHDTIATLLLEYYIKPHDARAQLAFIQIFKDELNQIKRSTSNNLLACRSILLDATISTHESDVGGISKILGTKRSNLHHAMEWCCSFQILEVFQWAFFQRKKNGLMNLKKKPRVRFACGGLQKHVLIPIKRVLPSSTLAKAIWWTYCHSFSTWKLGELILSLNNFIVMRTYQSTFILESEFY